MKVVDFDCAVAGKLPPSAPQPAGDRTTGISAKQGAIAVARNILSGGIGEARIAAMAVNFTEALHGDKPNRLPKHVGAILAKTRSEFQAAPYQPTRMPGRDISHRLVVEALLSPTHSSALVELIADKLIKFSMETHCISLDNLRDVSAKMKDGLYVLIIKGDFTGALDGVLEGSFPGHDRKKSIAAIKNHAKCFAVRTAHDRVQIFDDHSRRPYGDHFAGFKTRLLMGHTIMATLAAPAAAMQRFVAAAKRGDLDNLNDEKLAFRLGQLNILPSGTDGVTILRVARKIVRALERRNRNYGSQSILQILEDSTKAAASLNRGDMKREGLSQRGFAEHRTGLTGSEGASYIALELLRALNQIDQIVEAAEAGQPMPGRTASKIPKQSLAFASVILRSESQPDKNASTTRARLDADLGDGPDPYRKSGRMPMISMLDKMRCPKFEKICSDAFGIDALVWFQR